MKLAEFLSVQSLGSEGGLVVLKQIKGTINF